VFFIVSNRTCIWYLGKNNARVLHFAGDRFVSEIEAESVCGGPADDAREQRGCGQEFEIGEVCGITSIP
jgi:hypothetical protein